MPLIASGYYFVRLHTNLFYAGYCMILFMR